MKITIESTTKIVEVNGLPCRIWEGKTESGIEVHCFIHRVSVSNEESPEVHDHFKKELIACAAPSLHVTSYPLSIIL